MKKNTRRFLYTRWGTFISIAHSGEDIVSSPFPKSLIIRRNFICINLHTLGRNRRGGHRRKAINEGNTNGQYEQGSHHGVRWHYIYAIASKKRDSGEVDGRKEKIRERAYTWNWVFCMWHEISRTISPCDLSALLLVVLLLITTTYTNF